MDNIFISVIIPTYNRKDALIRAIDSVLSQTYTDFELIIVDDGSTDDTSLMFKDNDNENGKIKYIYQENGGVSKARNTGIKFAKGDFIAFLDSDDEWLPKKLEKQVDFLKKNKNIKICHTNEIWIKNGLRINQHNKHKKYGGWIYQKSLYLCLISPSAVIIHKSIFEDVGMFNEEFKAGEDYDLWLRITPYYEIGFLDDFLIKKYGGHEDQLSIQWGIDTYRILSLENMINNHDLNKEYYDETLSVLTTKLNILYKGFLKYGKVEEAEEYLNKLNHYQSLIE